MRLLTKPCFSFRAATVFPSAILLFLLIPAARSSAQTAVVQTQPAVVQAQGAISSYVCPQCGRVHAAKPAGKGAVVKAVAQASYRPLAATSAAASAIGGGVQNVLSILNGQRSRQGLRSLRYDPALQLVAERRARQMANSGIKGHPPGSFAPGRYEGVGWSSSFSPSGVHACYTSDPRMTAAGAAMVAGRDGVYFAVVYR